MTRRPKRKHQNSRRAQKARECKKHLEFVRGYRCLVNNEECSDRIEAAHVRIGTDGGTGLKPSDEFACPLCSYHHGVQHHIGEISFEQKYGVNLLGAATRIAGESPAFRRLRRMETEEQREDEGATLGAG